MNRRNLIKIGAASIALSALYSGKSFSITTPDLVKTLKLGLIGVGARGSGILRLLNNVEEIKVTAICDIMEPTLKKGVKLAPNALSYLDYRQLLADKSVDAVLIALPEYLHFQATVDTIKAGKHVYLEKTMTHTLAQADDLCALADLYPKTIVQIGHQYRYYQLYYRALQAVNEGWIGQVSQYECQYHRNSDWRRTVTDPKLERAINWRMYRDLSGGLMTELCAHQIDVLNWFTSAHPLKVSAMGGIDYWKDGRETYDNIRAIFEYPNGVRASVSSILGNSYDGYSIRILGTEGTIVIQQDRAFVYPERTNRELDNVDGVTGATKNSWGQGQAIPLEYTSIDGLNRSPTVYALLDFARCIREGDIPISNLNTGRLVAKAVFMANAAAETDNVIFWNKFN